MLQPPEPFTHLFQLKQAFGAAFAVAVRRRGLGSRPRNAQAMNRASRIPLWGILSVLGMLPAAGTAAAETILYSNIGSAAEPYRVDTFSLGGANQLQQADWFIPSVTGTVGSLEVPIRVLEGAPMGQFFLLTDAGTWPGVVIDTFTFSDIPALPPWPHLPVLSAANAASGAMLTAGTKYWLLGRTDPGTHLGWSQSDGDSSLGQHYIRMIHEGRLVEGFENVGSKAAFRLSTSPVAGPSPSPVPEPASLLLFATGAGALLGRMRVRNRRSAARRD